MFLKQYNYIAGRVNLYSIWIMPINTLEVQPEQSVGTTDHPDGESDETPVASTSEGTLKQELSEETVHQDSDASPEVDIGSESNNDSAEVESHQLSNDDGDPQPTNDEVEGEEEGKGITFTALNLLSPLTIESTIRKKSLILCCRMFTDVTRMIFT